jgi:hypothetical protein
MQKSSVTVALVSCFAITEASCTPTPQTAQTTQISRACPPLFQLADIQPLACYVNRYYQLEVGNASAIAIPKGTPISFVAKLANAGAYCATAPAREPIPPHLFVVITTPPPILDNQAPCQAWRKVPPVFEQ